MNVLNTVEEVMEIIDVASSEGKLAANICIEKLIGTNCGGSGGLWDTEKRPAEPQGGLEETRSHDPSSLSSDSELLRSSC